MSSVYCLLMIENTYMTGVRLSQSFLQLGLDEDTLCDEFFEYQLQDDAEMPKQARRRGGREYSGPCPPNDCLYLPKQKLCPPSEDCAPKKLIDSGLLECKSRPETHKIVLIALEFVCSRIREHELLFSNFCVNSHRIS